jgi:hypothetical protein
LDEEKSKCAGLAQENGFSSVQLYNLWWLVKAQQNCAPPEKNVLYMMMCLLLSVSECSIIMIGPGGLLLVIYFFPTPPIKLKVQIRGRLGTNSKPPGPVKLSTQSTAGVRLCCAIHHSQQHPVQKCWAKTILLSQTDMRRLLCV